jgi:ribosomal protein S18 acetylase RimI-like enzyme
MTEIKRIGAADQDLAVGILVLAFSADPAARWLYRDSQQYLANFPDFIRAFAGAAFEHGSAYCAVGYSGAALWLPPEIHPDEQALAQLIRRTVCERDQADVVTVLEQMDSYHPAEPHWYLPMIGVDPAQQGKGYGSALLAYALARCDLAANRRTSSRRARKIFRSINDTGLSCWAQSRSGRHRPCFRC